MDVCRGLAFIHERGVVHRDLKPQNVFLGSDGKARIGDFGLALAPERSRITQYGMMLGTVAYMPPEQALGGDVTGRSDLYSLGAMLYEMVTGRTPFVGDDPTAVISQHVNTPPVAPSWLTEHCPPPLEDLILRMLAKNPADRPESALAVLADLERIDPEQKSATHSESNALDRLARGVFVGRDKELERLRKAFDEAYAGRGGLVMVVGEPGIGKTRTTQELETYARMRGAQVVWGRAHESSGAPPYWPWVQAGRMWGAANDITALQEMMRSTQGELTRLFPELRNIAGFVEPETVNDPESAQFRLFDAYTTFVRGMTLTPALSHGERGNDSGGGQSKSMTPPRPPQRERGPGGEGTPVLIVLDDLHWADKPSLLLLQHLSRELGRMRVLVVGTFRDTELSRTHPLSEALANLNREAGFQRVVLRGLTQAEVGAYIRAAANVDPKPETVRRIFEETEGNPFFLSEVVNLLTQEGTLMKESVSDIAVPDGVREALGRRLDRISEETNELLQVAAVVGREFTYDTLTLLGDRDDDELLRRIEEALGARVIEEMEAAGRYRFTHALMQETLLDELSTTRRVRLHGQVGEALEKRWGVRAELNASRLANHFGESATLTAAHEERAHRYATLAAEEAVRQFAWAEAVRWYERAIPSKNAPTYDALEAAAIWKALVRCKIGTGDFRGAWVAAQQAIADYSLPGREREYASTVLELTRLPAVSLGSEDLGPILRGALARRASLDAVQTALVLARLAGLAGLPPEDRRRFAEEATELGSVTGIPEVAAEVAYAQGITLWQADGDYVGAAERLMAAGYIFAEAGSAARQAAALDSAITNLMAAGRLTEAAAAIDALAATSALAHEPFWRMQVHVGRAWLASLLGDLGELASECAHLKGHPTWGWIFEAEAALAIDGPDAALLDIPVAAGFVAGVALEWTAELHALAGRPSEAVAAIEELATLLPTVPEDLFRNYLEVILGHHALLVGDDRWAEAARRWVLRPIDKSVNWAPGRSTFRIRGECAVLLGMLDEAEGLFRDALNWCEQESCRIEAGRCLQGLADAAARRGDVTSSLGHLDHAAAYFQQVGARFFLDQVIAKKVELQGITSENMHSSIVALSRAVQAEKPDLRPAAAPDGTVTLMFSDIENSTALNEGMGDARWMEVLRAHDDLIRRHVQEHGGFVVKTMGDGFMVAFASASAALRCAMAIQGSLGVGTKPPATGGGAYKDAAGGERIPRDASRGTPAVQVRIGLHTGEAVRQGDDFYGRHVNIAARVAASALGGEVAVSGLVREIVGSSGEFAFDDGREVELKGIALPQRVYRVQSVPGR
jgi:class 3 adenylate cyclase